MSSRKKGLVIIVVCFTIIQLLATSVEAATVDMELIPDKEQYKIDEVSTVEIDLKLTGFKNIEEDNVLGCSAEIEYDNELLTLNNIEGQNGWNVEFNKENNKLILDVDNAKANTVIAKIIFDINTNKITKNENTVITLNDIILTDGNFKISSKLQIEINIATNEANKDDVQRIEEIYTTSGEIISNQKIPELDETTLKDRILPYVGNGKSIFIAIGILIIFIIIFKIKSRKIKY